VTAARGTILVTGAAGFVGSALCPALAAAGWTVRAAGRGETGDIGPDTDWSALTSGADAVAHLAARVHVMRETTSNPAAEFNRVNRDGTAGLARAAAATGARRFVFVSTVKVHGETSDHPLAATDPARPADDYARSKWAAEQALAETAEAMETVVLRPPLVYGPGVGGNFHALMRLVARGLPLPLAGLHNRRSLIARGNLVSAILWALDAPPGAYLPSDGEDLSTPALIRRLAAAMDRPARLFAAPESALRLAARVAGRAAAFDRLSGSLTVDGRLPGWQPGVSVDDALAATAAWYWKRRTQVL
jgi:nucleoside-diphosphate-sugar epimerase